MWFLKQNKMTAFYTGQQCSRVSRLFSAKHLTLIVIRLNGHNSWLQVLRLRILIWPDFCSALIVGRLAPLGLHNTRFRSVPVSCSPRTGADASSSTTRPTGTSPIPGPSNPGRACVARRARSCTRRRRSRPWRCRTSRRPCRPREACRIPRPWWCTRG